MRRDASGFTEQACGIVRRIVEDVPEHRDVELIVAVRHASGCSGGIDVDGLPLDAAQRRRDGLGRREPAAPNLEAVRSAAGDERFDVQRQAIGQRMDGTEIGHHRAPLRELALERIERAQPGLL